MNLYTRKLVILVLDVTASTPGEGIYMVAGDLDVPDEIGELAVQAFRLASPANLGSGYYRRDWREGYCLRCAHAAEMLREGWEP